MRCTRGIVRPLKQLPLTQIKRRWTKKIGQSLSSATFLFGATLALHVLVGCMSVDVEDRQSVSRLNTEFSGTIIDGRSSKIKSQLLPGLGEQRFVSKPNMEFSRSAVYSYSSKIMPQIQPGLAVSGGAQASTCTSCR